MRLYVVYSANVKLLKKNQNSSRITTLLTFFIWQVITDPFHPNNLLPLKGIAYILVSFMEIYLTYMKSNCQN